MSYDPTQPSPYDDHIRTMAEQFDIPHDSFRKLLYTESTFNPQAVSPHGAKGVAQFMPATGKAYGLLKDEDFFDPLKSIQASANYLADLKSQYNGNWAAAVAHYNGGTSQGKLVASGAKPTKSETLEYLDRIGVFAESNPSELSVVTSTNDIIKKNIEEVYEGAGIEYNPASSVNDLPYDRELFKRNNVFDTALGSMRSEKDVANEVVNILDSVRLNSTLGAWTDLAMLRLARFDTDGDYFGRNSKPYQVTPRDIDTLTQKFGSMDHPAAQWVMRNTKYEGDFENLLATAEERKGYNEQVAKSGMGNTLVDMAAQAIFDPLNFIPLGMAFNAGSKGAAFAGRVFNSQLATKLGWWSAMAGIGGTFGAASEGLRQYTTGVEMDIREAFVGGALMISAFHGLGALGGKTANWLRDSSIRAELIETGTKLGKDLGNLKGMSGNPAVGKVLNNLNRKTIARWEAIKKLKPKMTLQEWTEASPSEMVRKFGRMFYPDEIGRPTAGFKVTEKGSLIGTKRGDTGAITTDLADGNRLAKGEVTGGDTRAAGNVPEDEIVNVHRDGDTIFDTRQRLTGEVNYYREQYARAVKRAMSKLGINFHDAMTTIYHAGMSGTISKLPEPLRDAALLWKESMQWAETLLKDPYQISGKQQLSSLLSEKAGQHLPEDGFYVPVRSDGEKVENLINTIGKERERAIEELREEMANNLWEGVIADTDRFDKFSNIIDRGWEEMVLKDPTYKNPIEVLQEQWVKAEADYKKADAELVKLYREIADIDTQLHSAGSPVDPATITPEDVDVRDYMGSRYQTLTDDLYANTKVTVRKPITDYLQDMIDGGRLTEKHNGVAEMLKRIIDPNMQITVYDKDFKNPRLGGYYWAVTNDIHIPARNADNGHIILHETLHAVAVRRMRAVSEGRGTALQREAYNDIIAAYDEALDQYLKTNHLNRKGDYYGFTNFDEFVAEGLTNPQFYTLLKGMKSPKTGQTLYTKIMKGLQKLFGIGNAEATLLDDLFTATEKLLRGRTKTISSASLANPLGVKIHPAVKPKPGEILDTSATLKGLDEVDGMTPEMIQQLKDKRKALSRKAKSHSKKTEALKDSWEKMGAFEDIPNKVYSDEIKERAYRNAYGYLNRRLDDRNFWDSNGGFDEMSPYEERMPWDHYYKGKNSNVSISDILDTKMMDLYDGYMNRVAGDLSVLDATGSTDGFQYLKNLYNEAAQSIPEGYKDRERELRAMKMMVYQTYGLPVTGVSKSGARSTKSFIEGMLDTAANMGLFTKNAAFGIMNYFEVAAGIRAYGTSFFFKNIPGIGPLIKRMQRGAVSANDLRMFENMTFHKDIGETLFWPREYEKNIEKYNNKFAAALVTGSKLLANNSPFTQFMYASQNTIVSTARQELLAEMTRYVHTGKLNPKGFFTDKHLKRLGLNAEELQETFDVLKRITFMDDKGHPRISEDYFENMTPKFQHQLGILGEYVANEVIQRETPGSMFLWKGGNNNSLLTLLLQFKSFALKSINKRIMKAGNRYAYEGDKDFVYEYFIDSALQSIQTMGLIHVRANAIKDKEKRREYMQKQYGVDEFTWDNFDDPDFLYHVAMKGLYDRNSRLAGLSLVTGAMGLTSDSAKSTISTERQMKSGESDVTRVGKLGNKVFGYIPSLGYIEDTIDMGTSAYNLIGSATGSKNLTPKEKEKQADILWNSIKSTLLPNDPMFIAHLINFAKENHKEAMR